ncbi:MAG: hypothetical protein IH985_03310 [Planctomycetes bacterium]|nr:hypothetical protein [Planctomycetota bacterium]
MRSTSITELIDEQVAKGATLQELNAGWQKVARPVEGDSLGRVLHDIGWVGLTLEPRSHAGIRFWYPDPLGPPGEVAEQIIVRASLFQPEIAALAHGWPIKSDPNNCEQSAAFVEMLEDARTAFGTALRGADAAMGQQSRATFTIERLGPIWLLVYACALEGIPCGWTKVSPGEVEGDSLGKVLIDMGRERMRLTETGVPGVRGFATSQTGSHQLQRRMCAFGKCLEAVALGLPTIPGVGPRPASDVFTRMLQEEKANGESVRRGDSGWLVAYGRALEATNEQPIAKEKP